MTFSQDIRPINFRLNDIAPIFLPLSKAIKTALHETWPVSGNTKGGSITVPLTSCLTGLEFADNFCFYLQNRLIQTSQRGCQEYSDTSPFSIPWFNYQFKKLEQF